MTTVTPAQTSGVKLYVDDIRECPDNGWTLCRSNLDAIKALDLHGSAVMQISLDHDISHPIHGVADQTCSCAETFEVTARYIALMKRQEPTWRPAVTVHTSNPLGAKTLETILKSSGLMPLISLQPPAHRG